VPVPTDPQIEGESFDVVSFGKVRHGHALEAAKRPDSQVMFEYQDSNRIVATRAVNTPNGAFVLLVMERDEEGKRLVDSAYRLYGNPAEITELASDAKRAFQVFLERYCRNFSSGGRQVRFVPVHITKPTQQLDLVAEFGLTASGTESWSLNTMAQQNGDGTWTMTWPFVVNSTAYEADIRERQR
jgi:hypothetical protein